MQSVSIGDNLHGMSNPVSWENKKKKSKCRLLKILSSAKFLIFTLRSNIVKLQNNFSAAIETYNPFIPESLQWARPSMTLDTFIVAKGYMYIGQKSRTE